MAGSVFSRLISLALDVCDHQHGFNLVWHGGEPLTAGASFFREMYIRLQENNPARVPIRIGVQTNGTLIDDEWIAIFRDQNWAVGLSVDGPEPLHNKNRLTRSRAGTFEATLRGARQLRQASVPFTVIAVLTRDSLSFSQDLIRFFYDIGAQSIGFNIEEIESANKTSSLNCDGIDKQFDLFWSSLTDSAAIGDLDIPVREISETLLRIAFGAEQMSDQHIPLRIVTCDWQGNLSTFSPELIGAPSAKYGTFQFGNVQTLHSLREMLQNNDLIEVHRAIKAGLSLCSSTCGYFSACGGGAPANKFFENGDFATTETLFCRLSIQSPIRHCIAVAKRVDGKHHNLA